MIDQLPRGASEGPLSDLTPVFIDLETHFTDKISLQRMTLRSYLAASFIESMAVAIGDTAPEVFSSKKGQINKKYDGLVAYLTELARDPQNVFVAHNAAFDIRALRFCLGIPQPENVWCSMEGAMAAWPELLNGYSLRNIAKQLRLPAKLQKDEINLKTATLKEKRKYNKQDVRVMQEIYYRQIACIPALEQEVALRTHRQRQFYFEVGAQRLDELVKQLAINADYVEGQLVHLLTADDRGNIFNRDSGILKSVRSQRLLEIVNKRYGTSFTSTSIKKVSPVELARNKSAGEVLTQAGRVNKMLSQSRRVAIFSGTEKVDVELGYARACTLRFSSPSVAKGLNLHNIPKRDFAIAKPVRTAFRLPANKCFVRGDLANVEYRYAGKLTECSTVMKMFDPALGGNVLNDPYVLAWKNMVGQTISKKSAIRQVAKAAVLALGFCMSAPGYARKSLLPAMADEQSGVTEEVLKKMAQELGWKDGKHKDVQRIIKEVGCSEAVALSAFHVHESFNRAHQSFRITAEWLVAAVNAVAGCMTRDQAKYALDKMYDSTRAPKRDLIGLFIDEDRHFPGISVRAQCGPWVKTLCWRDPKIRMLPDRNNQPRKQLSIIKATGEYRAFTKQLAIENVVQAAARNGLCWAVAELERLGFGDCVHIHDEILLIVDRNREAVLRAREAMIAVVGPNSNHPMSWACLVKPNEISVTQSLWESEDDIALPQLDPGTGQMVGNDRWGKIERNEPGCLEDLP